MKDYPQKRHNSHEGRAKSDSVQKEYIPTSALDKRNNTITTYEKDHSLTPDIIKRINTGGGKRQMQPRQNPSIGNSPRSFNKVHLTPSDKKKYNQKNKRNVSNEQINYYQKLNRKMNKKKEIKFYQNLNNMGNI